MDVAFLGLGNMGRSMAANLAKAGHKLTLWNRTAERAEEMRSVAERIATTPAEAASTGVMITMLSDDRALESVVFGADGILAALPPGGLHISMSTISVALSRVLTQAHSEAGQQYLAACVLGRPDAAAAAKLFLLVGGPPQAIEKCSPLFGALGQRTFIVGDEPAAANAVKLALNFLIASTLESFGEAFALGRKFGIPTEKFLEILTGSAFTAPYQQTYAAIIARGAYRPAGFPAHLGLKDLRLALAAAESAGVPMPVASLVRDRLQAAIGRGYADLEWAVVARLAAEDAGL